jgi:hypothetical protein
MTKFIPKVKPKKYITKNVNSHCGVYALDNIINTYSVNKKHPAKLHESFFGKRLGWTLPKDMAGILRKRGFVVEGGSARRIIDKILFLENTIKGGPVIICIDLIDKDINPILGRILRHWIVLWGYDSKKKIFYAYDSRKNEKNLPVGNCTYQYDKIKKIWGGALMPFVFRYIYLKVKRLK